MLGTPVKLSETPGSVAAPPPKLGQHTDSVLTVDLAFTRHEVDDLRAKGVV
jgi:formyl-CoA transferase/CoA:oxalate CoA-transferase